jgi:hypothetical protein
MPKSYLRPVFLLFANQLKYTLQSCIPNYLGIRGFNVVLCFSMLLVGLDCKENSLNKFLTEGLTRQSVFS